MRPMMFASMMLNVAVLIPVCGGLLLNATWVKDAYGPDSSARQILLAVYIAIGLVSTLLLLRPDPRMIAALLLIQVLYKLMTTVTVGSIAHPVVVSNLIISAVHVITLMAMWRSGVLAAATATV